ncbi:MAG: IPT/TIG domain-containing protein, partial [Candidatus Atribacteria bacterium]|nr:IPT/TIG domain-containing protein [Candidatus Atribacteria bacterium]
PYPHHHSPPVISSLSPTCGPAGTVVLITGTGFGNTPGASTVKFFSGVTATVNSWSATSISVTVPAAATTGNVVVTVDGRTSNEVMFTNPCGGQPTQQPNPQQLSLKAVMPTH